MTEYSGQRDSIHSRFAHDDSKIRDPPGASGEGDRGVETNTLHSPRHRTASLLILRSPGRIVGFGEFDYLEGDLIEEWYGQIRELSKADNRNPTPRLEFTTHLPLGNIKLFSGFRNKREKSMQWLRSFIYEMKGTNTPPNDWCMMFELSLQDGALHW
ncbi:hypothetical protein PHMEG_00037906 [Phytophthora megakarya]|uniref:Eukaryotic/viral aspartic protease n=1 Tax=Phytophthora megakarya TaxID=4795 RepID=A0A225UIK4_9STRA|nr:hypothetical protein PHMEG_00037906 [Phytophthora megakarya]